MRVKGTERMGGEGRKGREGKEEKGGRGKNGKIVLVKRRKGKGAEYHEGIQIGKEGKGTGGEEKRGKEQERQARIRKGEQY